MPDPTTPSQPPTPAADDLLSYCRRQRTDFASWPRWKRQGLSAYGVDELNPVAPAHQRIAPGSIGKTRFDVTTGTGAKLPTGTAVKVYSDTAYVLVDGEDAPLMIPQEWIEWDKPATPSTNTSQVGHKLVDGASALHAEIMNLPCNVDYFNLEVHSQASAYELGCRDTRLAAAELAQKRVGEVEAERDDALKRETSAAYDRDAYRHVLEAIREDAMCHHADQPAHVLLHSLTVDIPARIAAAFAAAPAATDLWTPTHVHRKGGKYRVITRGLFEWNAAHCVVYDDEDGQLWVRPASEFDDGRFTPIDAAPGPAHE